MGKFISVRLEHRPVARTTGQRRHDLRIGYIPDYVDRERTENNSVIISPEQPAALRKLCEERRATRKTQRKMKTDAAVSTHGIVTFSREAQPIIEKLSIEEQNTMFESVAKAIAKRLDTDLTGLVIHRDEAAIHCHFQMPAVAKSGLPVSKLVTKEVASELQDIAGKEVETLGISRGEKVADRRARGEKIDVRRSVRQMHNDLPKEIANLQAEIQEQEAKAEKNRRLIEEQQKKLESQKVTEEQAAKRIETYAKREQAALEAINNAQKKLESIKKIEKLDLPKPPEVTTYPVVTETGIFHRPKKITTYRAVPVDEVNQYIQKIVEIPEKAAAAINVAKEQTHSLAMQLKAEQKRHEQTKEKLNTLEKVLDAVLRSDLGNVIKNFVPALRDWAAERERERESAPFVEMQELQRGTRTKRDTQSMGSGMDF